MRVDPTEYEPDIAAYLRKAAVGECLDDVDLKGY
jgi:hypothetical protein